MPTTQYLRRTTAVFGEDFPNPRQGGPSVGEVFIQVGSSSDTQRMDEPTLSISHEDPNQRTRDASTEESKFRREPTRQTYMARLRTSIPPMPPAFIEADSLSGFAHPHPVPYSCTQIWSQSRSPRQAVSRQALSVLRK